MADVITRLKVESSEYDSKIKRATQSLNEMTTAAEREGNKIATANKENIALAQSLGKMATVSTTARGKMSELSAAIESATIQYNRLTQAEKQGQFGKALNASIGQLQTRLAGLKTEMAAVQTQMGKTNAMSSGMGGMGGFGAGLKGGLAMMGPQAAGFAVIASAAMGLKKAFSDLVNINKEFEQSHANLASVMGKTRGETEALATQAKQLGATTQYTAMQILDLQTNLARLGFSEQEILNSTKAVQALATATNADLGEAANLAGAALRGFGLDASEMDRVSSVLAVSTSKSALSFEKLATAIPIVAPVAKQFGFSIEDTVTMIGKLSDAGMDASSAATATRNIFLKMADGGGKLSQAMGRPVHSVEEFGEALKDMKERGMDLNDILKMVGVRSTAAFAVFADNADTLGKFKGEITNCGDQLDKMVAEQLNTLEGSLKILNSAWEGLMLSFKGSNGILRAVTDKLAELLQAWSNWNNRRQGGEAAISTYTTDMTRQDENKIKTGVDRQLQRGTSAETIIENTSKKIQELKKEEKELMALEAIYTNFEKKRKDRSLSNEEYRNAQLLASGALRGGGYSLAKGDIERLYQDIAKLRDQIQQKEFKLDYAQSKVKVEEPTTSTGLGNDLASNERAKIEAEMQKAIADLDKVNMIKLGKEQEYEDQVFAIKAEAYDRIKKLYAEDSKEYSQMEAKIAQLTIQHQGTQMRLANKGKGSNDKPKEEKLLNYSQEGIANLGSQIKGAMSKSEIGSEGYLLAADQLLDFTTFENLLKAATERGVQPDPEWMASLFEDIKIGADIDEETWQAVVDSINELIEGTEFPPIKLDVKTGGVKEAKNEMGGLTENVQGAIGVFGQLGSAMQQIEDPGAKVAGMIMEAIAGIAATFAASLKGTFTPWDWIAAAISGASTMIGVIASIKSVTKGYAGGGMVEGTSYSGDNIVARLNAGEGVLTSQGVQNAAMMADGAGQQRIVVEGRISGKDILLSANNTNRAAGGSRGYYTKVK